MYRTPYLIQRITKPTVKLKFPANRSIFGFYQGEANSDTAQADRLLIRAALPLDSMGSAEFEFGAVPKSFRQMAAIKDELVTEVFEMVGTPETFSIAGPVPTIKAKVYLLCRKDQVDQLKADLEKFAKSNYKLRCKETPKIKNGLFGEYDMDGKLKKSNVVAWFDLDNLWFLTTTVSHLASMKLLLGMK